MAADVHRHEPTTAPDWAALHALVGGQEGIFTSAQAAKVGFSPQLLRYHVGGGRLVRLRRGMYRVAYWPAGAAEDLVEAVLWADGEAVVSHTTALAAHELSDVLPAKTYLTVPAAWARRRLRVPPGVVLHFADVPAADRGWFGAVQITKPARTLKDCAAVSLSPDLLAQALRQALARGLVSEHEVVGVRAALGAYAA